MGLAFLFAADGVSGRSQSVGPQPTTAIAPLVVLDPTLQAGLERIASGSPLWRQALEAVKATGRYAIIVTPGQLATRNPDENVALGFDPAVLAEVTPLLHEGSRVIATLVVVNVGLLEQVHRRKGSLPGEFRADLDRILIHEIYGHAVPYLTAGDLSGRCADPQPNQRASDACAIRRENAVRAELRLGRRKDAGLAGLALARMLP
jgi:hypothetical protein